MEVEPGGRGCSKSVYIDEFLMDTPSTKVGVKDGGTSKHLTKYVMLNT